MEPHKETKQSHEKYGQFVLKQALEPLSIESKFKGEGTTLSKLNSKVEINDAQIDGLIGDNCVFEIEAGGKKKYRAAIMDLWLHRHPKKLLIIMTAGQLGSKSDLDNWEVIAKRTCRECMDIFNALGLKDGDYRVVVLDGHRFQGSTFGEDTTDGDVKKIRATLEHLLKV